jgi:tRNA pseudouridine38-40 synthase
MRYLLELSYKGTHYHGWQKQPNAHSVQAELEQKLSLLLGSATEVLGCGRTDTGVHARYYVAQFDYNHEINGGQLAQRLTKMLPDDIAVHSIRRTTDDFHARFDARQRTYEYWITQKPDPFLTETAWYVYGNLDVDMMNEAAALLLTHSDFECFSKVHTDVKTFVCEIAFARWERKDDKLIFTIKANRFLRNMVRAIVGTLIEVGRKKMTIAEFNRILASKDRSEAGQSVPAHGLFLTEVIYGAGLP